MGRNLAALLGACLTLAVCVRESHALSDRMVDIGSHRLQISQEGDGAPAVVIDAGLADQLEKLKPLQERLAGVTLVVTYNWAGYGQSDPGPLPRDSGREAEELKALLEKADASGPRLTGATSTDPPDKGMKPTKPGQLRSFAA